MAYGSAKRVMAGGEKNRVPLAPGIRFGRYRILSLLGQGGMSDVYLVDDVDLQRRVALKVLVEGLSSDARARFVREARLAATVEHPNVLPVYEAGDVDGRLYIAMKAVDGPDLSRLIQEEGPLDPTRALSILQWVAGALDEAHENGLIHRDVKPQNILVETGGGSVYLSDFGLTKRLGTKSRMTNSGQLVGSVHYVSPEQIEGKKVDRRTDVYSLGCVLYEMLAGEPPFERDTDLAVLWAHATCEPPRVSDVRGDVPLAIDDVVAVAMAKSPRDRYNSCGKLAADLDRAMKGQRADAVTRAEAIRIASKPALDLYARPKLRDRVRSGSPIGGAKVLAIVAGVMVVFLLAASLNDPVPATRAGPDRSHVALTQPSARGNSFAGRALHKSSAGEAKSSSSAGNTGATSSAPGGATGRPSAPSRSKGPKPRPQTNKPTGAGTNGLAPGVFVFVSNRNGLNGPQGDEIYTMRQDGTFPTRLTTNVAQDEDPDWSPTGERIAFYSDRDAATGGLDIYSMNADGSGVTRLTTDPADDAHPDYSPDGHSIVFASNRGGDWDIYVMRVDGTAVMRLTTSPGNDINPVFSPDGRRIAFVSNREGDWDIYTMTLDGSHVRNVTDNSVDDGAPNWSPDGKRIVFDSSRDENRDIYLIDADGSGEQRLTFNKAEDSHPGFSPDGDHIHFSSGRAGANNFEIWLMTIDASATRDVSQDLGYDFASDFYAGLD